MTFHCLCCWYLKSILQGLRGQKAYAVGQSGALTHSASVPPFSFIFSGEIAPLSVFVVLMRLSPLSAPSGICMTQDRPISSRFFLITVIGPGKAWDPVLGFLQEELGKTVPVNEKGVSLEMLVAVFPPGEKNVTENGGNTEKYKLRGGERNFWGKFALRSSHACSHNYWTFLLHQHKFPFYLKEFQLCFCHLELEEFLFKCIQKGLYHINENSTCLLSPMYCSGFILHI